MLHDIKESNFAIVALFASTRWNKSSVLSSEHANERQTRPDYVLDFGKGP
jgi:hypothetical protein